MTIERARDWGWRGPRPHGLVEAADDAAAGRIVRDREAAGAGLPPIGLLGGDLRRTLGGTDRIEHLAAEVAVFTVDLGIAELDGTRWTFVSHLVARRSWWSGELLAVMNAELLGAWDVAPRSHPNDGRLDVLHVEDLPLSDRWKAWRRLRTGTHLPHPAIQVQRTAATEISLARPLPVRLDGVVVGEFSHVAIRVEPDALTVCI